MIRPTPSRLNATGKVKLSYITYITLDIFKVAKVIISRTTGRNEPNKLRYNVRIRLPKQMRLTVFA